MGKTLMELSIGPWKLSWGVLNRLVLDRWLSRLSFSMFDTGLILFHMHIPHPDSIWLQFYCDSLMSHLVICCYGYFWSGPEWSWWKSSWALVSRLLINVSLVLSTTVSNTADDWKLINGATFGLIVLCWCTKQIWAIRFFKTFSIICWKCTIFSAIYL